MVEVFEDAVKSNSKDWQKHLSLAKAYAEIGEGKKGIHVIEQMVVDVPLSKEPWTIRQTCFMQMTDFFREHGSRDQLIRLFERILEENPSDIEACKIVARIYFLSGENKKAENIIDKFIHSSESEQRFYQAGNLALEVNLARKAVLFLRQHVDKNPNYMWGYRCLANALLADNLIKEAEEVWKEGFAKLKEDSYLLHEAGLFYRRIGRYDKAIPLHTKYFEKYGRWKGASLLANTYLAAEQQDKAEAVVKEYFLEEKNPHPSEIYEAQEFYKTIGKEDMGNELHDKYLK